MVSFLFDSIKLLLIFDNTKTKHQNMKTIIILFIAAFIALLLTTLSKAGILDSALYYERKVKDLEKQIDIEAVYLKELQTEKGNLIKSITRDNNFTYFQIEAIKKVIHTLGLSINKSIKRRDTLKVELNEAKVKFYENR